MGIPFIHRVDWAEWPFLVLSLFLVYIETLLTFVTALFPRRIMRVFDRIVELVYINNPVYSYYNLKSFKGDKYSNVEFLNRIKNARNFAELCKLFGYKTQSHIIKTEDGYILTLHRVVPKNGEASLAGRPVVYLHHGLLMNSEVWVTMMNASHNLPFLLSDLGYDVWLGNNRGNKYSKKHVQWKPEDNKFWDFSIDEFAMHDIPDSINHILGLTKAEDLTYVGFSQGTAQGFAALSLDPALNKKVNGFVALSPAITPKGLHNPVVDSLIKASPILMFLFFGRKVLLSSATFWNSVIYPPLFIKVIDYCNILLFNWYGSNIVFDQKILSYAHLYSSTSVKSVVHWFQIMRNKSFQMYDDSLGLSLTHPSINGNSKEYQNKDYVVPSYPTETIKSPILLIYGKADSLVDIDVMLKQLPKTNQVRAIGIEDYEHLEIIWGDDITKTVFPNVISFLDEVNQVDSPYHSEKLKNIIEEDEDCESSL